MKIAQNNTIKGILTIVLHYLMVHNVDFLVLFR